MSSENVLPQLKRLSAGSLQCHKATKHLFFFLAVVSLSFKSLGPKGPE